MIHHGFIAIQVRDSTTNILKKVYSVNCTKDEGEEDSIARQSEYGYFCEFSDESCNVTIKMTDTSGTMTIDAIWIYK